MAAAGLSWDVVCVDGEPSPELVDRAVAEHRKRGVDVVLGIGGGSAIDAAKAIAALLPFGNSVMDHLEGVGRGIPYEGSPTPCVAVPTTAGTGSEATKNAVLSSRGKEGFKRSFRHDSLIPVAAVIDPVLTYTCPPDLTAATGLDAVTQLVESYTSTGANAFTDALALSGLSAAKDGLESAYNGEAAGRSAMSYAALLSGITLAHAGLGVVHGLASPLGAFYPIPHGVACATLLPPAVATNIRALLERDSKNPALNKYVRLGLLLSGTTPTSLEAALDALVTTLSSWTEQFRIPKLRDYGVQESDLIRIAQACTAKTNPAALTQEEMVGILRAGLVASR